MKRLLLMAVLLIGGGCASMWDEPLAARVGLHIDEVIRQMGYPDGVHTIAGRKLYHWERRAVGTSTMLSCKVTYEVDAAGVVVDYDWQGQTDACLQFAP